MFHTAGGVRVPLQHLWVPKALRRELRGQSQQECFQHMAPAVSSAAPLPQDCAPLICVRASPAPAPGEFGNLVITNSTLLTPGWGKSPCSHCF